MTQSDGERISLYLDHQFTAEERAEFERDVETRPELKEQLRRWRDNDGRLRSALDLPLPADLVARLGLAPDNLVDLATHRIKNVRKEGNQILWFGGGAVAASIAALLAFLVMPASREIADPLATPSFQIAMQQVPSRQAFRVSARTSIPPELSFADATGRFCREYALQSSNPLVGIACRDGGRWKVEGTAPTDLNDQSGEIRTAGGEDRSALDPIYARLQPGDPFDTAQEGRLIISGWRSNPADLTK
jgi:hypothetical protein